jgi:hypothetical protein
VATGEKYVIDRVRSYSAILDIVVMQLVVHSSDEAAVDEDQSRYCRYFIISAKDSQDV